MSYEGKCGSDFVLGRDKIPGEDRHIFLLGTERTARQFSESKFKSGDGTFAITPRMFYQVYSQLL